jgi:hypothetical protein
VAFPAAAGFAWQTALFDAKEGRKAIKTSAAADF